MFTSSWFPWRLARQHKGRSRPAHSPKVRRTRLACEQLEDRTVPSNFTAADVDQLIAAINAANQTAEADTIALVAGTTYTLTQVNNTTNGATGLPTIAAGGGPLTIQGNGDTIARSTATGTPAFRLFDVAAGASLTLANVTLQGGLAYGTGAAAEGGAIYSSGSLTLEAGTLISGNKAVGSHTYEDGAPAFGGGVYVAGGTATLTNARLSSNSVQGGEALWQWDPDPYPGTSQGWYYVGVGGDAYGGGLYVAGGTATLTNATLSSNIAIGGVGTSGGFGAGGGLYVAGGTVTATSSILSSNTAQGGQGPYGLGWAGEGFGGGLYVAGGTVMVSNATISSNSALGGDAPPSWPDSAWPGMGAGGGVFVRGGTVSLTNDTVSSNSAVGGTAWANAWGNNYGGTAEGGGLAVWGGTVTLRSDTVTGNIAKGGTGSNGKYKGGAYGGGLYISATVYLDAFTLNHTKWNKPDQIYGSYILI